MLSQSSKNDHSTHADDSYVRTHLLDLHGEGSHRSERGAMLLQNHAMEVTSLRISAGDQRPLHSAPGEAAIYCVEGHVLLHTSDARYELTPGVLVCLAAKEPHRLEAIQDALLLTIHSRPNESPAGVRPATAGKDVVQEAAEGSFPASDPPSWTTGV